VSSKKVRERINDKKVRELGKNEGLNTEVLLVYNGDWVEKSPLAKAEWIKLFGVLYNKEKVADSIFNKIETDYNKVKKLALNAKTKPTVLSGAMQKDIWNSPNGTSTEAQLLKDANANYLWKDTKGKGSLALNFEVVFNKAKTADLWISPSYYKIKKYTLFLILQEKLVVFCITS